MNQRYFEAIIFDHDGTLIDTETPDFLACEMLYQEFGETLSLQYWTETIAGRLDGYDQLFADLLQRNRNGLTTTDLKHRLHALWQQTMRDVRLMPGVNSLLSQLQAAGYPLGVATASDSNWVNRWLTHFNLASYFQVVATSDNIHHNKPAPDVYLFAASQLQKRPEQCLVFEDTLVGVQAAKAAGMTVIAVPGAATRLSDFSQADGIISGLDKVTLAWIAELAQRFVIWGET